MQKTFHACSRKPAAYVVKKVSVPMEIDADWEKWKSIKPAILSCHMGDKPAHFPPTQFKLVYDEENLYVIFRVEDQYVKAVERGFQVPVYQDSCVEFFFTPHDDVSQYFYEFFIALLHDLPVHISNRIDYINRRIDLQH